MLSLHFYDRDRSAKQKRLREKQKFFRLNQDIFRELFQKDQILQLGFGIFMLMLMMCVLLGSNYDGKDQDS